MFINTGEIGQKVSVKFDPHGSSSSLSPFFHRFYAYFYVPLQKLAVSFNWLELGLGNHLNPSRGPRLLPREALATSLARPT